MGVLFALGSSMFLIAAVASLGSSADWVGVTFFCGSIFFTAASAVQLAAATEVPHRGLPRPARRPGRPRAWIPAAADWFSAVVQFPGTLLFNINTFAALNKGLSTDQTNVRVWVPDMIGSACFLLSSLIAFANLEHSWLSWRPGDLDWWIAGLNLLGSVAFGVAAIASLIRPATGFAVNDRVSAIGTAIGALCFLIGAVLLLPQAERAAQARQAG
jgi:hypothetical protein